MPGVVIAQPRWSIRQARLEGAVVALIREWATAHPDELMALDRMVKGIRRETNGISDHSMYMAEIPVSLHHMIENRIKRGWTGDPKIRSLVLSNFTVGCINRSASGVKGE